MAERGLGVGNLRCNGWAEQVAASAMGRADLHASIARPGGTGTDGVLVEARASCLPCFHIRSSYCELLCTVYPQIPVVDFTKFLRRLAHFWGSSGDKVRLGPVFGTADVFGTSESAALAGPPKHGG